MPIKTRESVQGWMRSVSAARRITRRLKPDNEDRDVEKAPGKEPRSDSRKVEFADEEKHGCDRTEVIEPVPLRAGEITVVPTDGLFSRLASPIQTEAGPSRIQSPSPSTTRVGEDSEHPFHLHHHSAQYPTSVQGREIPRSVGPSTTIPPRSRALRHRILARIRTILVSLCTPQAITIFVAFPCALITPLKALFTPVDNSPIPNAPDGQPPLAFILDTARCGASSSVSYTLSKWLPQLHRRSIGTHGPYQSRIRPRSAQNTSISME